MASNKLTKAQLISELAKKSGIDQKTVDSVLTSLRTVVEGQLSQAGPGEVVIPYLVKLKSKATPATQDRPGVNPFTKLPITIKGKPASLKIKATPVKALKEAITPIRTA